MTSSINTLDNAKSLARNDVTLSGEFWTSLETNFSGYHALYTVEAETLVSNLTQYKLCVGDDIKTRFLE